ncbi:MAG: M14 family zinc carboxypeptidase, partial [Verrucomicrobiota bacterium]
MAAGSISIDRGAIMHGVSRSAWAVVVIFLGVALPVALPVSAEPEGPRGLSLERLFPGAVFDPSIPTQEAVLGVAPAARPLRHDELVRYLEALDAASPRASLHVYARTVEGRPMIWFAVGDEARVADLEGLRAAHARRLDPRGRTAAADAELLAGAPAVAWMAYGIHGDELSSVDAAAALAYWLVAGEDDAARRLRSEILVLIDPCENPDGRDRFLAQTTAFAHTAPNPDSEDLSHTTVWPWGRGNHYLFDLNRDWFTMVQPESRRSAVIASWNPQLVVDSHEMGPDSSYLFSPSRHPFNPHLPERNMAWADRFAADQARALDARGYAYYTREWNEEFFPGYGSSWASYLGAVGILYEMSRTTGTLVRQRGAGVRTYAEAVEHQLTSSVANLTTLAVNRAHVLRDQVADRRSFMARAGKGGPAAWFLPRGRNPERTDRLVGLLRAQGIEVERNAGEIAPAGLRDARTGAAVRGRYAAGSLWMVSLDQPAAPLVRNLLDPHVPMDAAFLREEREYQERGKGTRLYEVTAWSLPLSYGVESLWSAAAPGGEWTAAPVDPPEGAFSSAPGAVAYVFDGIEDRAMPALADLLQRGIRVRVAEKPFRVNGTARERGAQ